jgi:transposase InsO family protein
MPFGLTTAPATFQGAMNTVLAPLLRRCVLVFLDDILIYSATFEAHIQHLREVLQLLRQNDLKVKLSKCTFAKAELSYLGHKISAEGVATEDDKIKTVQEWPIPVSVKELRGFLGLAGYYRKFVQHFGLISRPLTDLLKKGTPFLWTTTVDTAFRTLKRALVEAPVLALPNFAKKFVIETDASGTGIGAVLMQDGHPIAYLSKALCPRNLGLSAYEKECLALLLAVDHWRPYLQHDEFTIRTDQRSLLHLTDQRLNTPIQQRAFTKLLGLQFRIQYKQGHTNRAADALSRRYHTETVGDAELTAITVCRPAWLETIQSSYHQDPEAQNRLMRLSAGDTSEADYVLKGGLIRYKGRIWIGKDAVTQQQLVRSLHDSAVGGHSGFHATYHRVKRLFAWAGMKQSVKQFVQECVTCQQAKTERRAPAGLLQPLDIPGQPWEVISLDFIEGLPRSANHDTILVIVDKFSRYSHFIPLKHPFTALQVAKAYMTNVFKIHGLPQAIISDRDRIFTSTLWQELFRLSQTELRLSSSYHPQSDGQTERVNQCLEAYLRCAVHSCPGNWFHWLHLAEYWYNTSYHSALGTTPFQVLFNRLPREFGTIQVDQCQVTDLAAWLREREIVWELLKQQLIRAQQRMKHQADKHRTEREFAVGDHVFLKLQP